MKRYASRFAVNCSLLFTELPVVERPAAAKAAGFDAVEFWWPFAEAVPPAAEVDRFASALDDAGVQLVGLNFFAGDMPSGDRGLVSWPGREQEFRDNAAVVAEIGERTGCRGFNALYGNRLDGVQPGAQDELGIENLVHAAKSVAAIDGTVLVEPVSGAARYPLLTADDAVNVITTAHARGAANVALLADLFHLRVNGDDIERALDAHAGLIGHVQIADAPGRGEPGTGEIEFERYLAQLDAAGYTGWIALEYKPSGPSADAFGWLHR